GFVETARRAVSTPGDASPRAPRATVPPRGGVRGDGPAGRLYAGRRITLRVPGRAGAPRQRCPWPTGSVHPWAPCNL
ncbi:MAG: hypothetical protein SNJ69_15530, partial [Chloroflexaceae bacterium]